MKRHVVAVLTTGLLFFGLTLCRSHGQGAGAGLEGSWEIVSIESAGKKQSAPKDASVTITKDQIKLSSGAGYSYRLDASKSPKWIDLSAGKVRILGIYDLKDDIFRMCLGVPDGLRATAFATKEKTDNDTLLIMRRAK